MIIIGRDSRTSSYKFMNAPERFNTWRWEDSDNETRLKFEKDTKMPNAGTFIIGKEDHTIGNLLRM